MPIKMLSFPLNLSPTMKNSDRVFVPLSTSERFLSDPLKSLFSGQKSELLESFLIFMRVF